MSHKAQMQYRRKAQRARQRIRTFARLIVLAMIAFAVLAVKLAVG